MYASVRRFRILDREKMLPLVESGFIPVIKVLPGFISYSLINLAGDIYVSISVFETLEQAENSREASSKWAEVNIAGLVEAIGAESGEIVVYAAK